MPDIVVVNPDTPVEPEENEVTWESVLLEIRMALQSGFDQLLTAMREMQENPRLVETLTGMVTSLTAQLAKNNETLMLKMDSLIQPQSTPTPVVIVENSPSEEAVPEVAKTESVPEAAPELTPRKRRTI